MATEKRLIDANALLERLESNTTDTWAKNLQAVRNWWPHAVGIKDNIVSMIKNEPTVDAVEVVHGYWMKTAYAVVSRCSCCDKPSSTPDCLKEFYDYCPNCGAKMDGGNEDV